MEVKSDPERGKLTSIIFTFTITIRSTLFLYLHDILMAKFIVTVFANVMERPGTLNSFLIFRSQYFNEPLTRAFW
jgi:hypothetical protein